MNLKLFTLLTAMLITSSLLQSCKNKEENNSSEPVYIENKDVQPINEKTQLEEEDKEPEYIPEDKEISFPKTGKTIKDFVPQDSKYDTVDELKIDLNKDGLIDIVLLLFHKNDPNASRPILVLLQNEDKSYRLDAMSRVAMPSPFTDMSDTFDYGIEKDKDSKGLYVYSRVYGGFYSTTYGYQDDKLIATKIYMSMSAAGYYHGIDYTPSTGLVSTLEVEQNMATQEDEETRKSYTIEPRVYTFEHDNPRKATFNQKEE